jgi:DNA-binding NtrC family response regulator
MADILLIEDDEELAYALSASLRFAGHLVTVAGGGFSALQILDMSAPIDLLLTALVLPQGQPNGLALARMARLKRPRLAVIFMTGHPDLRKFVLSDKLLLKPIDIQQLLSEITASLARIKIITPPL